MQCMPQLCISSNDSVAKMDSQGFNSSRTYKKKKQNEPESLH